MVLCFSNILILLNYNSCLIHDRSQSNKLPLMLVKISLRSSIPPNFSIVIL